MDEDALMETIRQIWRWRIATETYGQCQLQRRCRDIPHFVFSGFAVSLLNKSTLLQPPRRSI